LAGIGYPALDEDTIGTIITKEQISELILEPALEDYYKFFPKRIPLELSVGGSPAINSYLIPNTITSSGVVIGVINVKFVSQSSAVVGTSTQMMDGIFYGNPFASAFNVNSVGGNSMGVGSYGTPFGYGFESIQYLKKFYAKSVESSNKVYWYNFDRYTNTLKYKSNIAGKFYFELGVTDSNIDNIQFDKKRSFIKYCKGLLKIQVAETLSLIELDLPATLNSDALQDKGEELVKEQLTYWAESSSIIGMR
jgi:hypothetical protein